MSRKHSVKDIRVPEAIDSLRESTWAIVKRSIVRSGGQSGEISWQKRSRKTAIHAGREVGNLAEFSGVFMRLPCIASR